MSLRIFADSLSNTLHFQQISEIMNLNKTNAGIFSLFNFDKMPTLHPDSKDYFNHPVRQDIRGGEKFSIRRRNRRKLRSKQSNVQKA